MVCTYFLKCLNIAVMGETWIILGHWVCANDYGSYLRWSLRSIGILLLASLASVVHHLLIVSHFVLLGHVLKPGFLFS